jgi:hypothetical protein
MGSITREMTPIRNVESSPLQSTVNKPTSDIFPTPPKLADLWPAAAPKMVLEFRRAASTPPEVTNENSRRMPSRTLARELPTASQLATTWDRQQLSKKRSQYYGEVFAYREPHNTAKDRVTRDSVIMAEIKLNCKVRPGKQRVLNDTNLVLSSK